MICLFARGIYGSDTIFNALSSVGFQYNQSDLDNIGTQTLRNKYAFKEREGFRFDILRLPGRIFETASPVGTFDEAFERDAIQSYYQIL